MPENQNDILNKIFKKLEAGREIRNIDMSSFELRSEDNGEMIVDGYATTFNQPYLLLDYGDYKVYEQIDSRAFDKCDMSDVVFLVNHTGRVSARTRNKTLDLSTDKHGLKSAAHLGGTEYGRQIYEEISGGYLDRMSMSFIVGKDSRVITEDRENHVTTVMRTITEISKLYDVSAVSFPANDATEISARSYFDGVIEELRGLDRLAAEKENARKEKIKEIRQILGKN